MSNSSHVDANINNSVLTNNIRGLEDIYKRLACFQRLKLYLI